MAAKYRIQLRNIQNVGASKTALITCPIGKRYHYINLQYGYTGGTNTVAGACAHLSQVRVKLNDRVQRTYNQNAAATGHELLDLALLNGTAYGPRATTPNTAPGVSFPIFFAEPWRNDEVDQDALAWPTTWIDPRTKALQAYESFQIEVDVTAAVAGSSADTLSAYAVVDDFVPTPATGVPAIVKVIRQSVAAVGAAIDVPGFERRDYLQQITIYPDTGNSQTPAEVDLRINGQLKHELSLAANLDLITQFGMLPAATARTASLYDLVLDHDGLLASAEPLDGTRDFTLTLKATSGQTFNGTVILQIQRLGPPE